MNIFRCRGWSFNYHTLSSLYWNLSIKPTMPFYAVAKGVTPGIYTDWSECQKQINGFKQPQFKKFSTRKEADEFIQQNTGGVVDKRKKETAAADKNGAEKKEAKKEVKTSLPPPELQAMKQELKQQQKDLSLLRQRFDAYVSAVEAAAAGKKDGSGGSKSADAAPETSNSNKGKKRERSPDGAEDEADGYQSGIKKRVLDREPPSKDDFEVDASGNVVVYTDGCCEFNGRHGAKAGVGVYFGPNNPLNVAEPVRGRATNNTAEIQAITYALEMVKRSGFSKAIINTDSQFVINCMTSWLSGWKKRGWKKSDGSAVINKEDLIDLDNASEGLMVKYNHVKGHSGLEGNEMADKLAKEGAKGYDADVLA